MTVLFTGGGSAGHRDGLAARQATTFPRRDAAAEICAVITAVASGGRRERAMSS